MSLRVEYAPWFEADLHLRIAWYIEQSGLELGERFILAVHATIRKLAANPHLGKRPYRDCIQRVLKQGMADWNVEYPPRDDTPATYRAYQLQKFLLVKVWLHGGTLEIVARDFEIETNQSR